MDEKMASSARTLLGEGDGEGGDDANGTEEEKKRSRKNVERRRRAETPDGFFSISKSVSRRTRAFHETPTPRTTSRACAAGGPRTARRSRSSPRQPHEWDAAAGAENPKLRTTSAFHRASPTSLID
jgi:hypothetical protein